VGSHSGLRCSDTDLVNCAFYFEASRMKLILYRMSVIALTSQFRKDAALPIIDILQPTPFKLAILLNSPSVNELSLANSRIYTLKCL
jgi:hypothetical protein